MLRSRTDTVTRKTHAPKADHGLGEFKLDVAADAAVVLGFDDLADHFFLGFLVGEK